LGNEETDAARDEMSEAWLRWCDSLRRVPDLVKKLGQEDDPRIQAEGYRYLARVANMALERGFESFDRDFPRLLYCQGPARKIGGDCPDAVYRDCAVDGRGVFQISGSRGNAAVLIFSLMRNPIQAAQEGKSTVAASYTSSELDFESDGTFDLCFGGESEESQSKNWRPMPPDADRLIVRQFFGSLEAPEPALLAIERLDAPAQVRVLGPVDVEHAMGAAIGFFEHIPEFWAGELDRLYEKDNYVAALPADDQGRLQALPSGTPLWGSYRLAKNEALLVEFTPPACDYWSLLCGGHWFESLDYRTQVCHLNMDQVEVDEDGVVRAVVAHEDPGVPNWLETSGYEQGFLLLRYLGNDSAPEPSCRVIPFEKLAAELPFPTRTVSKEERASERRTRRRASDHRAEGI
jgi:hypothetical protein